MNRDEAEQHILTWLAIERKDYSNIKYDPVGETFHRLMLDMKDYGVGMESESWVFLSNYIRRAQLLGMDTPQGRQAFAKFIVTALGTLERAIMIYGPLPKPGFASGTIAAWE